MIGIINDTLTEIGKQNRKINFNIKQKLRKMKETMIKNRESRYVYIFLYKQRKARANNRY